MFDVRFDLHFAITWKIVNNTHSVKYARNWDILRSAKPHIFDIVT